MRSASLLFVTAILLLSACGDRVTGTYDGPDAADQLAYFPLDIGRYVVYQVDSIVYDFAPGGGVRSDSSRTFLREEVTDTFRDNSGQLLYAIECSERAGTAEPWQIRRVWSASRSHIQAIRTEDNLRFLKLVFPFDRRSAWDGNLWIDGNQEIEIAGERMRPFANWRYEVDSLDIPAQIGDFAFDSVLVVTEVDEVNAIEYRFSRLKYAKHIGLVWREQWILDSQYCNQNPSPPDCLFKPWAEKAEKGYILRQTVVAYH